MPPRLSELYRTGQAVEVLLPLGDDGRWLVGRVLGHQQPGVWVRTADGSAWFVTNRTRIRPIAGHAESEAA